MIDYTTPLNFLYEHIKELNLLIPINMDRKQTHL